jgi:light-regulated signal transduction histidine kinase (bacteriophytochrome)
LLQRELEAREAKAARALAETRAALVEQLERSNRELEAFSYSVSHDLRAPLRGIDGLSLALLEDYGDSLDARGKDYLCRVRAGAQRMAELIDDLLELSKVSRAELQRRRFDLTGEARAVFAELVARDPGRRVDLVLHDGLVVDADPRLMKIVLENLLGNAWKFTSKVKDPRIELAVSEQGRERDREPVYVVRDNGAGFDMKYRDKLFRSFQRLHDEREYPGTGIGLATVNRVIERHGGRVWAEGAIGQGAAFYFSLGKKTGGGTP